MSKLFETLQLLVQDRLFAAAPIEPILDNDDSDELVNHRDNNTMSDDENSDSGGDRSRNE